MNDHTKTVLQYSGGIDSTATLFVKRAEWDDLTVAWVNTGAAYPDVIERMARLRQLVPHFYEIKSDKPGWEREHGIGVDVLPLRYSALGRVMHGTRGQGAIYASYQACCNANIWQALHSHAVSVGATRIIRGQKRADERKAPISSGHVLNGVTYEFPIEDWTPSQVMDYCRRECPEWLPEYYDRGEVSSHDCWDCIAYLDQNQVRVRQMPTAKMQEAMNERLAEYRALLCGEINTIGGAEWLMVPA